MTLELDKLMTELGYISVHFSVMDYLIYDISTSLINIDNKEIGHYISIEKSTDAKIKMLIKLIEVIPISNDIISEMSQNMSKFREVKKIRNELIHGIWHNKDEDENLIFIGQIKDCFFDKAKSIELEDLIKVKETLIEVVNKQVKLNEQILCNYKQILQIKYEQNAKLKRTLENLDY